ncbi:MAG: glycosyltransferase family 2 protein [Rhodospirillaceae bacterium]|jgi:rSAM/selenodomain-associated transferase 2|nr:glycosyltransferase family 2 protein [Rhodospirillaceae bacterium]MBT7956007.1 glycosyltransferase family 2 protein [Rhodospirillaceae bacterium]
MITVIIPTFNEAGNLKSLLEDLSPQQDGHEIIVADGGSDDETIGIAEEFGAKIIRSDLGRGQQLKAGADHACGKILLFLHADSRFPLDGLAAIEKHLSDEPDCVGGNFRLLFDGDTEFSRWLIKFYAWIRKRGIYYGDSGVYVRRGIYIQVGGIKPLALMEDYNFTRRLEKAGPTCCIEEPALITSSRKFEGRRAPAIIWGWLKIHALYHFGVSPEKLAKLYYR